MTVPDDSSTHDDVPDDEQSHPEEALDALEERVFGHTVDQTRDEQGDTTPAFEQDLDAEDQGSGDAGTEPG